ncbi:hypothetical protein ASE06_07940 [Sphingopyxis sp. Root214]|uniref:hypothetical protein n=1 Tax=unclassified Sphingopyxis TaxID=2614943 RepID=UPI000700E7EA|nr:MULTISPECIES: hypothetical protein [unclassified Sphingopyxis]KQZ76371.1 hypothetical protein ASD73_00050 [Sphingopyxis sp. Root154]KRC09741.1 hypothetical protein ASE06_07940 [Sphingopyxis sp. Root214]
MQLTYAQLTAALAQMNNVSGNDGGAFRARLRKLQGEGIPGDANPGKGRRVAYTLPLVIETTVAVELLQMGWSTSQAASLIRSHRQDILAATLLSLTPDQDNNQDVLFAVSPEALGNTAIADRVGAISFVTRGKVGLLFQLGPSIASLTGDIWRWSLIDLAVATLVTMGSIAHIGLPNEAVVQALREAIEKNSEIIQNFRDTKLNMIVTEIEAGGSKMASIDRTKVPKTA